MSTIPSSIQSSIDTLDSTKTSIKNAIISKGVSVSSSDSFANYASKINTINTVNNTTLNVTPSTNVQNFSPTGAYTGYSTVNVSAVTASIDSNIVASNIKSGVTVLGVTGNVVQLSGQTKTLTAGTNTNTTTILSPDNGYNGLTSVTVDLTSYDEQLDDILGAEVEPVGTLSITTNGDYNTVGYAYVNVNVPNGSTGYSALPSYQITNGVANRISGALPVTAFNGLTSIGNKALYYTFFSSSITGNISTIFSNVTSVDYYGLYYTFSNCTNLTGTPDFDKLVSVGNGGLSDTFYGCTGLSGDIDLSSLTTVSFRSLYETFYGCTSLTSVDLSSLVTTPILNDNRQAFDSTFYGCTSLTSVDLSSLTYAGCDCFRRTFYNCTSLTSVDLSSLTTVGYMGLNTTFTGCTSLTSVDLSSLTTFDSSGSGASTSVGYNLSGTFSGCTNLTSVDLSGLTNCESCSFSTTFRNTKISSMVFTSLSSINASTVFNGPFYDCPYLSSISFPALTTSSFGNYTNQFKALFNSNTASTSGSCTVHFPSNLESIIQSQQGYPLFNGTSGRIVLAFDLPATT